MRKPQNCGLALTNSDCGDIDHEGCAKAILSGLRKRTSRSYLIHLTGTGCISDEREQAWEGKYNPHCWHDIAEIDSIYNLPSEALHHVVDRWIMDADNDLIKTALICPPDIYGQSTGVGGRQTFLVPNFVEAAIKHKEAFYLGEGANVRAVTHIDDVVDVFLLLLTEAIQGGGKAAWGKEVSVNLGSEGQAGRSPFQGFYFAVSDSVRWRDAAEAINRIGQSQGWLPGDSKAASWSRDRLASLTPGRERLVLYIWGSNSRAESARARKLGWKPHGPSFWESLEEDCHVAAKSLA